MSNTTTSKSLIEAVKARRTYYAINNQSPISDDQIISLVQDAVKYSPSAFNSQSARVVVLLGENHDKLWNIVKEALRKIVPADQFASTEQRVDSFKAGHGSVLFFEDTTVVEGLQNQFPSYADNFPKWSQHSSAIVQYVVWTLLEEQGLGASLQHYNPLIDEEVKQAWNIPASWQLIAQMPFGTPTAEPGEKAFQPIDERVKIFK
ncbi:nitroreductase family protein [Paenibacillus glycanilyticus]|uniref:nitroreductase family protein n=1 Tax=Paenibacillus glycanilyticus TaxID=126569 RepID=UPI0020414979|nr:nitroreductase family protein [Paenibacillus glycanilyticus]MCM3626480.1 nitroreductase family protein [Paenibacillus glycanilyticus]